MLRVDTMVKSFLISTTIKRYRTNSPESLSFVGWSYSKLTPVLFRLADGLAVPFDLGDPLLVTSSSLKTDPPALQLLLHEDSLIDSLSVSWLFSCILVVFFTVQLCVVPIPSRSFLHFITFTCLFSTRCIGFLGLKDSVDSSSSLLSESSRLTSLPSNNWARSSMVTKTLLILLSSAWMVRRASYAQAQIFLSAGGGPQSILPRTGRKNRQ